MKTKSKLEQLPVAIKSELIELILSAPSTYNDIAQWLYKTHGQKHSKSAICRFAQAIRLTHGGLIELGLSPSTLSTHASQLEKLGAYLIQRELLNCLINNLQKTIFNEAAETSGSNANAENRGIGA